MTDVLGAQGVESTLTVRGTQVRLLTGGTGDPVLYLHGSGDLGAWLPAHERLAADYSVYRPDLPGFNHSQPREDIGNVHDAAYSIWNLVDELGLDTIRVVGSSLGGWVADDLATIEPARISHLVLIDAAGLRPANGFPVDMFVLSPAEILDLTYHDEQKRTAAVAYATEREDDPDNFLLMLRNRAATAKLGWNPYMHDVRLPSRLHRVKAKTLVLWGREDKLVPLECGEKYAELIPGAQLKVIDGCGHLPLLERSDDALDAVVPFLAS